MVHVGLDLLFIGARRWFIVRVTFERDRFRTFSQGFVGHRCDRTVGTALENTFGRLGGLIDERSRERSTNTGQDFRGIELSDQLLYIA